mmetsp:Transcript_23941/g.50106  ORF Transcript_23941/g.50106 Transcript_23941/m.50106 type:complete len:319 (-) Transcript_23941:215-1171(-)
MQDIESIMKPGDKRRIASLCAFLLTVFCLRSSLTQEIEINCIPRSEGTNNDNGQQHLTHWEVEELPIMRSKSKGFRPIYIYSQEEPETRPIYSGEGQDKLIQALMDANDKKIKSDNNNDAKRKPPFFVDLGSNDPLILSNSYQLEQNGWNGLCIEPNPRYWYRLASFRTCTIVAAFVGGSQKEDGKLVNVKFSNARKGGIVGDTMDNKEGAEERRTLVSIETMFEETNVPNVIDYLSLDVEGAEGLVMKDFPWNVYHFKFMTIERPNDDLKILLLSNGYRLARTLSKYEETLWVNEEEVKLSEEEIDQIAESVGIKKY